MAATAVVAVRYVACADLEVLGAGDLELGHFGGGGHVPDGLDGGDDEGQDAGEDERRVDRQGVGEHPQEGDAFG